MHSLCVKRNYSYSIDTKLDVCMYKGKKSRHWGRNESQKMLQLVHHVCPASEFFLVPVYFVFHWSLQQQEADCISSLIAVHSVNFLFSTPVSPHIIWTCTAKTCPPSCPPSLPLPPSVQSSTVQALCDKARHRPAGQVRAAALFCRPKLESQDWRNRLYWEEETSSEWYKLRVRVNLQLVLI